MSGLEALLPQAGKDAHAVLEEDQQRPVELQTYAIAHAAVRAVGWATCLPSLTAVATRAVHILQTLDTSFLMQVLVREPVDEEQQLRLDAFSERGVDWPPEFNYTLSPAAIEAIEAIEDLTHHRPRFAPDMGSSAALALAALGGRCAVDGVKAGDDGTTPLAPVIISRTAHLLNAHMYAEFFLRHDGYQVRACGVQLLRTTLRKQTPHSLSLDIMERLMPKTTAESGVSALQRLVEHTATSPTKQARDECTATIHMYIQAFAAEPRHCLLSMLLDSCPFDPMYQLLVMLLKSEVLSALGDDATDDQRRFFTGGALWSLVYLLIKSFDAERTAVIADNFTKLSATLNLLLFMLMYGPTHAMDRVVADDATGVWRHGVVGELQSLFLDPLQRRIEKTEAELHARIHDIRKESDGASEGNAHEHQTSPSLPSTQTLDLMQFATLQDPRERRRLEQQAASRELGQVGVLSFLLQRVNTVINQGQAHL
ncbi:hypothetical protein PTSG_08254 [Salpingoeca rosetta]|uniref:Uncharacterized protein n=1 Tax=Salpingoeca rosetta (strain ATCC 50818 / BSB-021) TaxID=946362 RepID=F2UIG0_SALR5|nr:uncharacterized protein PTSG_08254 [Salpingoeca rosetta]EGD76909.1 hypothetical protein PTSG_08254 [Salpingoeca rosetta]|eukprot:XP_004991280.1 hypothetical protein PTSG_08254 [Salpingoeca rosetta]